jgi:hypothetical protein
MTPEQRAEAAWRGSYSLVFAQTPQAAREILCDGAETIGGGTRIARLAFDPATRSASIIMSDTSVMPFAVTVEIGR